MFIQDDSFLSYEQSEQYKHIILSSPTWRFNPHTNSKSINGEALSSQNETFQFVSTIDLDHPARLATFEVLQAFSTKHNFTIKEITRIKSNILTQSNNNGYHSPHIDQNYEHKVFLYYVNDSDGDTVFFNQFWSLSNPATENTLTEYLRVAPKQGLGVLFDGFQYHASTSPIVSGYRCVVNVDIIV